MLDAAVIQSHNVLLVLCPHCGGDGMFETLTFGDDLQTVRTKCQKCGHTSDNLYPSKENVNRLVKEWAEGSPAHLLDLPTDAPIIVNLGLGVDSVSLLVAMVKQGIKPDLIMFADVGGERPETYAYFDFFNNWLQKQGFPEITRVAYTPATAPYRTLEGNVLANETLPSISFRQKNCTLKFKSGVLDAWLIGRKGQNPLPGWGPVKESLAKGVKPYKLIAYDNGAVDGCRAINVKEDKNFRYLYPLRSHLKWTREDCITNIRKAGLPTPIKSSCFFCCSAKEYELAWYASSHPDLLIRSLVIEDTARAGRHGLHNVRGLWGQKESWREWSERKGIIEPGTYNIIMPKDELLAMAWKSIPPLESNLTFALPVLECHTPPLPDLRYPEKDDDFEYAEAA